MDALREARIIEDDSPIHVRTEYAWAKTAPSLGAVRIEITELPELEPGPGKDASLNQHRPG